PDALPQGRRCRRQAARTCSPGEAVLSSRPDRQGDPPPRTPCEEGRGRTSALMLRECSRDGRGEESLLLRGRCASGLGPETPDCDRRQRLRGRWGLSLLCWAVEVFRLEQIRPWSDAAFSIDCWVIVASG